MEGGWLPPQGTGQPPEAPPTQAPHRPPYAAPGPPPSNREAVAGFVCGVVGASLLLLSAGLSSVISLVLGVLGIVYCRKGKRNVEQGRTTEHRDLASGGVVLGIVTTVLAAFATLFWVAILVIAMSEPNWLDDQQNDPFEDEFQFEVVLRGVVACARLIG